MSQWCSVVGARVEQGRQCGMFGRIGRRHGPRALAAIISEPSGSRDISDQYSDRPCNIYISGPCYYIGITAGGAHLHEHRAVIGLAPKVLLRGRGHHQLPTPTATLKLNRWLYHNRRLYCARAGSVHYTRRISLSYGAHLPTLVHAPAPA
jgi:hypothetical protein